MENLQQLIDDLLGYIKGIWLKKRYIMIVTWLVCPLGLLLVSTMPDVYQSSAKLYADTRSILQPLLRGLTIQTNVDQEVQLMARTLLSRPNLEKIARGADMDINAKTEQEFSNVVASLRSNITLDSAGRQNIYTISYSNKDPELARKVVEETLDLFVESTLGSARKDSDTATEFLTSQIAEYEKRLSQAEQRLAQFKRENGEFLSSNNRGYYDRRSELEDKLENVNLEIRQAQSQLEQSQQALQDAKKALSQQTGSDDSSFSTKYDDRIDTLNAKLDELKIRFTDNHPDVVETENLLANLEELRRKEIEAFEKALDENDGVGQVAQSGVGENILISIQNLRGRIASLTVERQNLQEKLDELAQKIDIYPQIEAQLTALNRDYDITKRKYEELLSRRESANLAQQADMQQDDVQFRIIEPPIKPLQPSGPNRILFYTVVVIMGFAGGIGLAFLISQINPVALRPSQLTSATEFPVFGVVSHVEREELNAVNRKRLIIFWLSNAAILTGYAGFVVIELAGYRLNIEFLQKLYNFTISNLSAVV